MATVGQQLTAPETGWKRYDDGDPSVKYFGTFIRESNVNFYNGFSNYATSVDFKIKFDFIGTKIRIIGVQYPNKFPNVPITIDGITETFSQVGSLKYQVLQYEKTGLENRRHTVEIAIPSDAGNNVGYDPNNMNVRNIQVDAIDIDKNGRIFHPDEVEDIPDLKVGKRIRCHYKAQVANAVGSFSGFGQETSNFIPSAGSSTPNGDFYLIMVEDSNRNFKMIADRNIQNLISWDSINKDGIMSGSEIPNVVFGYDAHAQTTISDLGLTVVDTDDAAGATFKVARATQGVSEGKWYFEATATSFTTTAGRGFRGLIGVVDKQSNILNGNGTNDAEFVGSFNKVSSLSYSGNLLPEMTNTGLALSVGDTIGVALDLDNGKITYYKNGTLLIESTIDKNTEWFPFSASKWLSKTTFNFGYYGFKYDIPAGYKPYNDTVKIDITARLLTGGVSSSDTDNEWNHYIVSSTLNGKITAGDNGVWNFSGAASWTSTTNTAGGANRTYRGNASVGASGYNATTYVGAASTTGFRPMLIVDNPIKTKSFLKINGEYKKFVSGVPATNPKWTTISITVPSEDTFMKEGMHDLSVLDRKEQIVSLPMTSSALGEGRVFKAKIDYSKYFDINSINVK